MQEIKSGFRNFEHAMRQLNAHMSQRRTSASEQEKEFAEAEGIVVAAPALLDNSKMLRVG